MKKYNYNLEAIVNGSPISVKKEFKSRNLAIEYAFKLFEKNGISGIQVENEIKKGNKHNIEYVCNSYYNRFTVTRQPIFA